MMHSKPVSSLQKTYDECYRLCATAVYFEGQNNEDDALCSWRSALEVIYYHRAHRLPPKFTPKSEIEKALHESIHQLEIQCRERVDLLQALQESRKEAQRNIGDSHLGYEGNSFKGKVNSASASTSAPASGKTYTPGWIAGGTIPAVEYADLSKPPPGPGLPRPQPSVAVDSGTLRNDDAISQSQPGSRSHGSSPDRRKPMLTTLRAVDPVRSSKRKSGPKRISPHRTETRPAASQAAGMAWESVIRSPSSEKRANNPGDESNDYFPSPHRRRSSGLALDTDQPRSPSKPATKPNAVSLQASQRAAAEGSAKIDFDPAPSGASQRRSRLASVLGRPQTARPGSRTRLLSTRGPYSQVNESELFSQAIGKTPTGSPTRRKLQPKRSITPPSSGQDSSGDRSVDEGEDGEDEEDEEDAIEVAMKKLPKGIDPDAARQVLNDVVAHGDEVRWSDIAGLEVAKRALKEAVVYPFLRPDLFSGLREPARGMLLFGPPGTGKTMLARAVATESKCTFFSVSASTLTSKWHGGSEKLVRTLFSLAKVLAPSIIFIDEIDSLLSSRSSGTEHEASRRSKTEFLVQWSDLQRAAVGREQSNKDKKEGDASRVLVLAATNMPWDIDEAARRRFVKRQYIPLPERHVRLQQIQNLLSHQVHDLSDEDIEALVQATDGFSGSDITALAKDAAMGPLRNLGEALLHTPMDQIRPIRLEDFRTSLYSIRPSVSRDGLKEYEDWANKFGERAG